MKRSELRLRLNLRESCRQGKAVEGLDDVEGLQGRAGFVGLQMAEQMPSGVRERAQSLTLADGLLYIVFAEVTCAGREGRQDRGGGLSFGRKHEPARIGRTTAAP